MYSRDISNILLFCIGSLPIEMVWGVPYLDMVYNEIYSIAFESPFIFMVAWLMEGG
jgi:hypothetical protein